MVKCTICNGLGWINTDQLPEDDWTFDSIDEWVYKQNRLRDEIGGCSCHLNPPCSYCTLYHEVELCDCQKG
jgi:hypothetical protein